MTSGRARAEEGRCRADEGREDEGREDEEAAANSEENWAPKTEEPLTVAGCSRGGELASRRV
jgi:hypothetical protein